MTETRTNQIPMVSRHPDADEWARRLNTDRMPEGRWPQQGSVPVSVLVPVKNESVNLPECLLRLSWADQIVVVDSQSTDATIPIAQAYGAEVYQFHYNPTVDWMKKKNWSITNIPWRHEWLLIMDADEYMTPELADEVRQVVEGTYKPRNAKRAGCGDGYWINRRFMFLGRWIKHCGYYPSYNVRLFKHKVGLYERMGDIGDTGSGDNEVHEHVILQTGKAGYLKNDFLHYAYPNLSVWIEKHNRYSTWEAHVMRTKGHGRLRAFLWGGPVERRRWLKIQASYLPCRPLLRFLYTYVLRLGILDGYPGYVMSKLMAWYEFISLAKRHEMDAQDKIAKSAPLIAPPPSRDKPDTALPLSVVIFAQNEQDNIAECLKSCALSDDIHVVDVGSTDRTREIAQQMGARVSARSANNFAELCNWAIGNLTCKHEWKLLLNADERLRPQLTEEIRHRVFNGPANGVYSAYRLPSRLLLRGHWIRWSGDYPVYQIRLFRSDVCRFKGSELVMHKLGDDKIGTLSEPFDYHAFSKGLTSWFHLYNYYSSEEAAPNGGRHANPDSSMKNLWPRDPIVHPPVGHKSRLPGRAHVILYFLYMYLIRLGLLDGRAGFHYCSMLANYQYWVKLKQNEQHSHWFEDIDRLAETYLREKTV